MIGFLAYGDSLRSSIIDSIQTPWIQITVNSLVAVHCILAIIIHINPVNQELEELLNVPQGRSII